MKKIAISLISLYQLTLSPDHGMMRVFFPYGACRFYPTCSEYMKKNIKRHGVVRGVMRGLKQLLQCHPFRFSIFHFNF